MAESGAPWLLLGRICCWQATEEDVVDEERLSASLVVRLRLARLDVEAPSRRILVAMVGLVHWHIPIEDPQGTTDRG